MDYVDKPSTDEWDIFTPPRWYIITPTLTFVTFSVDLSSASPAMMHKIVYNSGNVKLYHQLYFFEGDFPNKINEMMVAEEGLEPPTRGL
jgi:hypothetical protein